MTHDTRLLTPDDVKACYAEQLKLKLQINRHLTYIFIVTLMTALVTVGLFYQGTKSPELITIGWDGKGGYKEITPIRNPSVSDQQVINWTKRVVAELESFHYGKLGQVTERKRLFIDEAWEKYLASIDGKGIISFLREHYLIVHSSAIDEPLIMSETVVLGSRQWLLKLGGIKTVQGASNKTTTGTFHVELIVEEVDRRDSPDGLKIIYYDAR